MSTENWRTIRLGDALTLKRGYDLTQDDRMPGTIPVISSSGFSGFHNTAMVKGPGVVTGRYGTLGEVFYVEEDFWPHNTTLYVQDFKDSDPRFIFYFLKTLNFGDKNDKTSVPGLNRNDLHSIEVTLPSLSIQRRIAAILTALDDKIELNRRINKTLEGIARTLWAEWFGKYASGEEELPEGWRWATVGEVCSVNKLSLSKKDTIQWVDYIEISEVNRGKIGDVVRYERGGEPSRARRKIMHGDIVLSTVRPDRGAYFLAQFPEETAIVSTGFAVFTPEKVPFSFLYIFLTNTEMLDFYGQMADGGAYPAINPSVILESQIILPDDKKLDGFHKVIAPLFERVHQLNLQSRTLTTLRDALLPRLMRGEFQI